MTRALVWESWAFDAWTAIEARDPAVAERILLAIERYVETGRGDGRKLTVRGDLRRLRVGAWRVLLLPGRRIHQRWYRWHVFRCRTWRWRSRRWL